MFKVTVWWSLTPFTSLTVYQNPLLLRRSNTRKHTDYRRISDHAKSYQFVRNQTVFLTLFISIHTPTLTFPLELFTTSSFFPTTNFSFFCWDHVFKTNVTFCYSYWKSLTGPLVLLKQLVPTSFSQTSKLLLTLEGLSSLYIVLGIQLSQSWLKFL